MNDQKIFVRECHDLTFLLNNLLLAVGYLPWAESETGRTLRRLLGPGRTGTWTRLVAVESEYYALVTAAFGRARHRLGPRVGGFL